MTATAATPSVIAFNIYDTWRHYWVREWRDLGKLIYFHMTEQHIECHEPSKFNLQDEGWCVCFYCRVVEAWRHRHDLPRNPKKKKRA